MNTLTIAELFANFSDYEKNYLTILSHPEQYYTPVEDAFIEVKPFARRSLYLGDLLHLWLSQKWCVNKIRLWEKSHTDAADRNISHAQPCYLYQLQGNIFSGHHDAKVWALNRQHSCDVNLDAVFKYFCIYQTVERPKQHRKLFLSDWNTAA